MTVTAGMYRQPCGAAGYFIRFEDGSTHAIQAFGHCSEFDCNSGDCENCPFADADSAECVCGWEEADDLLDHYDAMNFVYSD